MAKQNVTGARKGVCLVCDRRQFYLGDGGERTPSKSWRRGLKLIPEG